MSFTSAGRFPSLWGFIRPLHRPLPHGAVDWSSTPSAHPVDYQLDQYSLYLRLREHPQEGDLSIQDFDERLIEKHLHIGLLWHFAGGRRKSNPNEGT
jgi:hypothetical protein